MKKSKPKIGDKYWFFNSKGITHFEIWDGFSYDEGHYKFGNCFKYKKDCEYTVREIKLMLNCIH